MQINRKYVCLFYLVCTIQILIGQNLSYEQYTDKDGLPSMQTYDILQDSTGLLWIGTENGLVSFDGDEFVRFSSPELLDNDIVEVALNRNNRIFFLNLSRQIGSIENNTLSLINTTKPENQTVNIITRKHVDYVFSRTASTQVTHEIKKISNDLFDLIPTDIQIFHAENQKTFGRGVYTQIYNLEDSTILNPLPKPSRSFSYLNKIYAYSDNLLRYEFYEIDEYIEEYIKKSKYNRLVKYKDDFFIITSIGVTYYDSKTKTFIPFLGDIKVNTIFLDSEGVAWVSTPNKGLLKISNLLFKLRQEQTKLKYSGGINDIYEDSRGNIYLGSIFSEMVINPFGKSKRIKISSKQRPVQFIAYENKVIGYDEQAVSTTDINSLTTKISAKNKSTTKALLILGETVYLGTSDGITKNEMNYYFSPKFNKNQKRFIIGQRISKLFKKEDTDDIFVGTIKGLYRLVKDSFELVDNDVIKSLNISSIADGDNNSIWVGTRTNGIYNVKNDSILYHYDTSNGLISKNIVNLEKNDNELLISTNAGLCIIDLSTNDIKIVNEYNFLPSNEVLVCKVIREDYWIGTINGLTILSNNDILNSDIKKPLLSLKSFVVNGVKIDYTSGMVLNHMENNIQLNLQNISFKSGREKQIKYRIPFIDTTWISTVDPDLRLPSLTPGNYQIEAIGINSIGIQSKPLNIYFKIDQAWWNKLWAKLLAIILLVGIVNFIFVYRTKRIKKEEKIKRDYLTQINKIKDQALQLQMNPHFIFNSLNAIQGFIGTDEEELAMNYLARFARLIRLIFEHSKGNTITLEEELEFMNLYLNLEKLRFKDKINVKISVDSDIENTKDIINIPPLLIQPIVENSFKHGLFHKKGKGNLSIDYSAKGDALQVVIQDDGVGRAESQKLREKNSEKQTSSGLNTTKERIDLLNFGKDEKLNSVKIEDLYDQNGNAAGTKTTLLISQTV